MHEGKHASRGVRLKTGKSQIMENLQAIVGNVDFIPSIMGSL
jgi:hypothetical protein